MFYIQIKGIEIGPMNITGARIRGWIKWGNDRNVLSLKKFFDLAKLIKYQNLLFRDSKIHIQFQRTI